MNTTPEGSDIIPELPYELKSAFLDIIIFHIPEYPEIAAERDPVFRILWYSYQRIRDHWQQDEPDGRDLGEPTLKATKVITGMDEFESHISNEILSALIQRIRHDVVNKILRVNRALPSEGATIEIEIPILINVSNSPWNIFFSKLSPNVVNLYFTRIGGATQWKLTEKGQKTIRKLIEDRLRLMPINYAFRSSPQ